MRAILLDYQGRAIRLPEERWQHIILGHPIMAALEDVIAVTLLDPEEIRRDPDDPNTVRLYYRRFERARAENRRYVVAVKFLNGDAYVLTSHPAGHPKPGEVIWTRSSV